MSVIDIVASHLLNMANNGRVMSKLEQNELSVVRQAYVDAKERARLADIHFTSIVERKITVTTSEVRASYEERRSADDRLDCVLAWLIKSTRDYNQTEDNRVAEMTMLSTLLESISESSKNAD